VNIEALFRAAFGRSMHDEILNNLPQGCGCGHECVKLIKAAEWFMLNMPDAIQLNAAHSDNIANAVEHQIRVFYYG
jgi:hypothetical protein